MYVVLFIRIYLGISKARIQLVLNNMRSHHMRNVKLPKVVGKLKLMKACMPLQIVQMDIQVLF